MITRTQRQAAPTAKPARQEGFQLAPIARAIALAIAASGWVAGQAQAQQAFSPAWFAQKGAAQTNATATGLLPNGKPANLPTSLARPSDREKLQESITRFNTAAQAIALQQALQKGGACRGVVASVRHPRWPWRGRPENR